MRQTANIRPSSGLTSTSIDRAPAPSKTFVRGKAGYVPFWPGGLEDPIIEPPEANTTDSKPKGLRTIPPGFARGLRLPGDDEDEEDLLSLDDLQIQGPKPTEDMVRLFKDFLTLYAHIGIS